MVKILGCLEVKFSPPGRKISDSTARASVASTPSTNSSNKSPRVAHTKNAAAFTSAQHAAKALERQKRKERERDQAERNEELTREQEYKQAAIDKKLKQQKTKQHAREDVTQLAKAEAQKQLETEKQLQHERDRAEKEDEERREQEYKKAKEELEKRWRVESEQEKEKRRKMKNEEWQAAKRQLDAKYEHAQARKIIEKQEAEQRAARAMAEKVEEQLKRAQEYQEARDKAAQNKVREQELKKEDEEQRKAAEALESRKREEAVAEQGVAEQGIKDREDRRRVTEKSRREILLRMHQQEPEREKQNQLTKDLQDHSEQPAMEASQESKRRQELVSKKFKTTARRNSDEILRPRPTAPARKSSDPETSRRNSSHKQAYTTGAGSSSRAALEIWRPYGQTNNAPFQAHAAPHIPSTQPTVSEGSLPRCEAITAQISQHDQTQSSSQGLTSQRLASMISQYETQEQKEARYRTQALKEQDEYIAAEGREEEDRNSFYERRMLEARIKGLEMASKVRRIDWDSDGDEEDD